MNFLAHLHLSGGYPQLLIGNFIADFLRGGIKKNKLPENILRGVRLHHAIDSFTDSHEMVRAGTKRLQPNYGKYSPVIIDVFYDHFLAKNWENFHPKQLPDFAQDVYKVLQNNPKHLPPKVKQLLPYMVSQDWLTNYAGFYGIERALEGLSRRASFQNTMNEAIVELKEHYELFDQEFMAFFPDILQHIQPFLQEAKEAEGLSFI